jgi:hypothetical protein
MVCFRPVFAGARGAAGMGGHLMLAYQKSASTHPHCTATFVIASEAWQSMNSNCMDCHVANAPRNDGKNGARRNDRPRCEPNDTAERTGAAADDFWYASMRKLPYLSAPQRMH